MMRLVLSLFFLSLGAISFAQDTTGIKPFDCTGIDMQETWHGVKYCVIKSNPSGKVGQKGDRILVHYSGYLENGTMFDSSVKRGQPFGFRLDKMEVIKGWDIICGTLREGEKARVFIPWKYAYGREGRFPTIPRKANLIFDIEIVSVGSSK